MKLSISNIAWPSEHDEMMYAFLQQTGYSGLEIAPTRLFPDQPYEKLAEAKKFGSDLKNRYGIEISSMQSICFGREESVFGDAKQRGKLFDYLKKAIDFAEALNCNNLVFGSPKNRIIGNNNIGIAYDFFGQLGDYAQSRNTVLAFEPNPEIYGTDFINTTQEASDFTNKINSDGLKINFDLGTFIHNNEGFEVLEKNLGQINHIHISEPYLEEIRRHEIHKEIAALLRNNNYDKFISIEMKNGNNTERLKSTLLYIKEVFHAA